MNPSNPPQDPDETRTGLWSTVTSVAASFFGVQSARNRRRDFSKGKPAQFIVVGLVMTAVFILVVLLAVRLALKSAGL